MQRLIPVIALLGVLWGPATGAEFVVVVHKGVKDSVLQRSDAEKMFLGKKTQWTDGSKVVPVTLSKGDANNAFMSQVVKKTSAQFQAFWNQLVFTGKGTPPISFETDADVVKHVAATAGAIGYVSTGADVGTVRAIKISE